MYSVRRAALVEALRRHAPHVHLSGLAAGFHAVATLHPSADEDGVIAAALERSIGLHGVRRYRLRGEPGPPQLVLGFGNLTVDAIARGIADIGDLLEDGW